MRANLYELKVLVRGRPISEYEHQGRFFIEGRRGSEFEIEFKNNSAARVLVVPSVDGVSTLNGQAAGPDSPGFAVAAHATLRIPGWMVDGKNAAKFVFEDRGRAYASYSEGGNSNAGVIGLLVFAEEKPKVEQVHHHHYIQPQSQPWTNRPSWDNGPWYGRVNPIRYAATGSATQNMSSAVERRIQMEAAKGMADMTQATYSQADAVTTASATSEVSEPFALGTGWGKKTDFETKQTTFKKGELAAQMVIYYDNRRNLEARGIQVVRNEKKRALDELPSAFPTMGCKPPPGWRG